MDLLLNLDLLSVGVAIAGTLVLGFSVYFSDKKSATNLLFLIQTIILALWSAANYASYQSSDPALALSLVRLVIFLAVPNSVVFLILMHTFPAKKIKLHKKQLYSLLIIMIVVMVLTVTPLVFKGVTVNIGSAPTPSVAPGIIAFLATAILTIPLALFYLIKHFIQSKGIERGRMRFLLTGVISMFILIIFFNFIMPTVFRNSRFVPLSAIFTLPFVILASYDILKHKLFNIKVGGIGLLVFALAITAFGEVIFAEELSLIIYRSSIFVLILLFGVMLIRGVIKEVRLREQVQVLAKDLEIANREQKNLIGFITHQVKGFFAKSRNIFAGLLEGDYGKLSKETGVKMFGIHPDGPIEKILMKTKSGTFDEPVLVPKEKYSFPADIAIYDDKIAYTSRENGGLAIIIESKEMASVMKSVFDLAFQEAKKLRDEKSK